jgi:spermidine synthase
MDAFVLAPLVGIKFAGTSAAVIGGGLSLFHLLRRRQDAYYEDQQAADVESQMSPQPTASDTHDSVVKTSEFRHSIWTMAVLFTLGALLSGSAHLIHQMVPVSSYIFFVQCGVLLVGLCWGHGFWRGQSQSESATGENGRERVGRHGPCLFVALLSVVLITGYGLSVDGMLTINAYLSSASAVMFIRAAVTALPFLVVGIGWGRLTSDTPRRSFKFADLQPVPLALGYVSAFRFSGMVDSTTFVISLAWLLTLLAGISWLLSHGASLSRQPRRLTTLALLLILLVPPFVEHQGPLHAKRLLFSTAVFSARRAGTSSEFLPVLDEGRHIATVAGERGTYTLWKYRGVQLQLCKDGVPQSVVSTRPEVCPDYTAESIQAVLPLALHEQPHRVLVLGLGGGVPLTTCLAFPIPEVTCAEDDSGLVQLVSEKIWAERTSNPEIDERLHLLQMPPVLALATGKKTYDVIISNPDRAALLDATSSNTVEFYRLAASRLEEEGLFCQRFGHIDFGPEPLRIVSKTIASAFRDVAAISVAPGETLFLGTNSKQGFVRGKLVERLQKPHVRAALARLGLDWTGLLQLPAYDRQSLLQFVADGSVNVNTASSGLFAFRLPREVIRWGPKGQELHDALAAHSRPMLAWDGIEGNDPTVLRRLAEVAGQQKLIVSCPDRKWVYRKALEDQMKKQRQSLVRQVSMMVGEDELHPQDQRRKDYLLALGDAADKESPTLDSINRVEQFSDPYDPLLSFFVHHEAAELHTRASQRDPRTELAHRLHLTYFASPGDRSVRNVADAIMLLVEQPQTVSDPVERFDYVNGLLQVLKSRWDLRTVAKPLSVEVQLNDINKSIAAIELAFAELSILSAETAVAGEDWTARKKYLDKSLLRPLRTYSSRLLPHLLKQKPKKGDEAEPDKRDPAK